MMPSVDFKVDVEALKYLLGKNGAQVKAFEQEFNVGVKISGSGSCGWDQIEGKIEGDKCIEAKHQILAYLEMRRKMENDMLATYDDSPNKPGSIQGIGRGGPGIGEVISEPFLGHHFIGRGRGVAANILSEGNVRAAIVPGCSKSEGYRGQESQFVAKEPTTNDLKTEYDASSVSWKLSKPWAPQEFSGFAVPSLTGPSNVSSPAKQEEGFRGGFSCPTYSYKNRGNVRAEQSLGDSSGEEGDGTSNSSPQRIVPDFSDVQAGGRGFGTGYLDELLVKEEKEKWKDLPEIKRDFYKVHPEVVGMSSEKVDQLMKEKNGIVVKDLSDQAQQRKLPKIITRFEHAFESYPDLMKQIGKQGFDEPTPIQCSMWPMALSGFDVIGIAQTGSGKTLGFLFPAFIHIEKQLIPKEERGGPTVLVLTPTRELAQQIAKEVKKYHFRKIRSVCVYGGGCRVSQAEVCSGGVDIVIATPGRLYDLMGSGILTLKSVSFLVLDEADRMLDMGFEPQIRKILSKVRPDRHTIMTSATWPTAVRRLGMEYTKDPVQVVIGTLDLSACTSVEQRILIVDELDKHDKLRAVLKSLEKSDKALIFVARKTTCSQVAAVLKRDGFNCQSIHGDRDQREREEALRDLRKGRVNLLVATDVASRGLDITDITYVINYDFPGQLEEYVHRIGRTGRAGKTGKAISFMGKVDCRLSPGLVDILERANQEVPQELMEMKESFETRMRELGGFKLDLAPPSMKWKPSRRTEESSGTRSQDFCDPFTGEKIGRFLN